MNALKLLSAAALLLMALITACTEKNANEPLGNGLDIPNFEYTENGYCLDSIPMQDLDQEEIDEILFMREEEKLARDVYLKLYEIWGKKVFQNIAESEQQHMDAILLLIERYDLDDPADGNSIGEFTNPDLQELYNTLIERGSQSIEEALIVGTNIEEIDIIDLDNAIIMTDNDDLTKVFDSLRKGSENHLRGFVKNLERLGIDYTPQFLNQELYDEIID